MMRDELPGLIRIGPRIIQTDAEFARLQTIRTAALTPWDVGSPSVTSLTEGRVALNAVAGAFPEFFYQARTIDDRAVGYFTAVPGYWGGAVQALPDLHYYHHNLRFDRRQMLALSLAHRSAQVLPWSRQVFERLAGRLRHQRLNGANSMVVVAQAVDPDFQGVQQLPALFFEAVKRSARSLGLRHIIAPVRPGGYGQYKALRNTGHSAELFKEYCSLRNLENWPMDPWLRLLARQGAEFLRAEPRSLRIERPLASFERLRRSFKADSWYSPEPDVWECGETPTWYVDRARGMVTSVEPHLWGRLRWDPNI